MVNKNQKVILMWVPPSVPRSCFRLSQITCSACTCVAVALPSSSLQRQVALAAAFGRLRQPPPTP